MCKLLLTLSAILLCCGCASSSASNKAKPSKQQHAFETIPNRVTTTTHRTVRNYPTGCRLLSNGYLVCMKD
jgi:ABC-type Zn uptake system ZnuABC Zn-binding protein ZnuA